MKTTTIYLTPDVVVLEFCAERGFATSPSGSIDDPNRVEDDEFWDWN